MGRGGDPMPHKLPLGPEWSRRLWQEKGGSREEGDVCVCVCVEVRGC